jgi:hypothetical protein
MLSQTQPRLVRQINWNGWSKKSALSLGAFQGTERSTLCLEMRVTSENNYDENFNHKTILKKNINEADKRKYQHTIYYGWIRVIPASRLQA